MKKKILGWCCLPLAAVFAERPNIVFILADDQRWDALGCAGNPVIQTPNIDRLAKAGIQFDNAFVTTSICMVSRASILTGQYARRHGVNDFFTTLSDAQMRETYPVLLRQSGYYTGFIGKWGIGDTVEATGPMADYFDFWAGVSHQGNYWHESTCAYVTQDNAVCDCPPDHRGTSGPAVRFGVGTIKDPVHFTTDVIPQKFLRFLDSRDPKKPFCISVSLKDPHNPYDYDTKFSRFYERLPMPIRENATPAAAQNMGHARTSLAARQGLRYVNDRSFNGELQQTIRSYYRLMAGADEAVGRMIRQLQQAGVYENTVIIYTSDNGYLLAEHGLFGKWLPYEESIRVPMIIHDPRTVVRPRCRATVLNLDVAPTILELAGLEAPSAMQGRSLLPLLTGAADESSFRSEWFYEHVFEADGQIEPTEAMISGDWKYIHYLKHAGGDELYNLASDPLELNNLSSDPESQLQLNRMRHLLDEMRKQVQ